MRPFFALCLVMSLACGALNRESGVMLPDHMDSVSLGYVESNHLLEDGEKLRCFYDATISLDGTELYLVTDKRVISFANGRATSLALADVVSIEKVDVPMSDAWLLLGKGGEALQVEVAVMNGGETFEKVMRQAWTAAKGG